MAHPINKQLTEEFVPETSLRVVLRTIIGTVVGVIFINFAALWYLAGFSPNTGYQLIKAKWNLMRSLVNPVDLLILGDSSGNQGVDPDELGERLGLSAINLCTIGDAMVLNDAWMLGDYIDRLGPPQAVLIVHGYDTWSRDINISVSSKVPEDWWRKEPRLELSPRQRIRIWLNRYAPLYAEPISLGHVLENPWTVFHRYLHLSPKGFMSADKADPRQVLKDTENHLEFVRQKRPVLSVSNRKALEYIGRLADQYRFDVFVANGPIYRGLYADSVFVTYYDRLRAELSAVIGTNGHMHYILDPPMTFDKEAMQSADHVVTFAAEAYTARLAREIKHIRSLESQRE